MVGYIIGVGMFGLPYLISISGILTFFAFILVLGAVQYLVHLTYVNLIVVTEEYHRMPGYAGIYLGKWGKITIFAAKMVGNLGAMLAYIIITGIFLKELFGPVLGGSEFIYASLLFFIEAAIVYYGIKTIAKAEFFMTIFLLLVVALIAVKGSAVVNLANFKLIDWRYLLLPYGAMLFSLDGCGSLPIVVKLLKKDKKAVKSVVRVGTILPILIVIIFTLVVVGISGAATTPDALVGIKSILNDGVILFSLIFGVLTMITSFLLVAESVKETLWWDFKVNKNLAWGLAVFIPYIFYVFGLRNLADVISFAGGVAGSLSVIMLIAIFMKLKKKKGKLPLFKRVPPDFIVYVLLALFIGGMFYEIYYYLIK